MNKKNIALVITTIASSKNYILKKYAKLAKKDGIEFIVKRNEHNLMRDFHDEISGYENNFEIMKNLINLKLKPGVKNIEHNMILCYKKLVQMNLIDKKEIKLLNAWFLDYKNIQ